VICQDFLTGVKLFWLQYPREGSVPHKYSSESRCRHAITGKWSFVGDHVIREAKQAIQEYFGARTCIKHRLPPDINDQLPSHDGQRKQVTCTILVHRVALTVVVNVDYWVDNKQIRLKPVVSLSKELHRAHQASEHVSHQALTA
jgi:hypothetical protein